jgi:hypothetical protein
MAAAPLTEDQLKTLVREALTAALAAQAAALGAAAAATNPPKFTLHPGDGAVSAPWDFTTGDGLKLFINGTKALTPVFDGKQTTLHQFLFMIRERANNFGWSMVLDVQDSGGIKRDGTTEYGALTHQNILDQAMIYQAKDERERQASNCLLVLIKASISSELSTELQDLASKYTVSVGTPQVSRIDGVLYLYELIVHYAKSRKAF